MTKNDKGIFNLIHTKPLKSLCIIYIIFISVVLIICFGNETINRKNYQKGIYKHEDISLTNFEFVDVEMVNDYSLITKTDDAQIIYKGDISNIAINCEFSQNPGEFVSFYAKDENDEFNPKNMIYAKKLNDKYIFSYPQGTQKIRLDLGIHPSITIDFKEIEINNPKLSLTYQKFTSILFYTLIVPPAIFSILDTLGEFLKKRES